MSETPEYIELLTEVMELRNEVFNEVVEALPDGLAEDHDQRFGAQATNELVSRFVYDEADRRLAQMHMDRVRAALG